MYWYGLLVRVILREGAPLQQCLRQEAVEQPTWHEGLHSAREVLRHAALTADDRRVGRLRNVIRVARLVPGQG